MSATTRVANATVMPLFARIPSGGARVDALVAPTVVVLLVTHDEQRGWGGMQVPVDTLRVTAPKKGAGDTRSIYLTPYKRYGGTIQVR